MADKLILGERTIVDLTGLIILGTYMVGNGKCTFREPNGTAGYQVPGGQTLTIIGAQVSAAVASSVTVQLLYADNDVGMNSTTAFTNPVYQFGDSSFCFFRQPGIAASGQMPGAPQPFATYFTVPTGKYPGLAHSGGGNAIYVTIYGKLS